ncbi:SAM-dependent chlorinase/fluorinase [Aliifodinibius sp. S!AR15-10]|uniref:SAM hydrolase/SAM-dependent halogenase family protein n=1 Tax=Aliifodinibius sp. S!AR15-10 TaxID=2950437 RepID=UPI0028612536|nr:SAM-dependent chlorinase/fluorinase [Aliifodinibius sp. S!AR15-10]MDR8392990.1 SAM-dependent chlorinase/fluorinase [Aliifodinibius sp. S!AR15-10]
MRNIVTLTTDFGLQDYYVSAMKAVMLGIAPDVRMVDISHEVPDQDIMAGSWVLQNSAPLFPPNSVHLVVIDPGVGTDRNPIALKVDDQYYVGPDNGIFSLLTENKEFEAVRLTNPKYWKEKPSNTFHGRDIFAPVAAHLSNGVELSELGEPVNELKTYRWASPIADKDGLQGWIIHIDKFGNLVTNLPDTLIDEVIGERPVKIYVGNMILDELVNTFGAVPEGEPAAYIGSAGMLEIGINKGDAAEMMSVKKGAQISLVLQKED